MRLQLSISIVLAAVCVAPLARADGDTPVAAQALFDEGKKLIAAERWQEACPKFAESQRLDPGVGTQYHLADCYEHIGRRASAWAIFREVEATTRKAGETERADITRARADALEAAGFAKLVIQAGANPPKDLAVTRDGVAVGDAQLGVSVPVDTGEHLIEASAPGKKPWRGSVQIAADGAESSITIPPLEDAPPAPTPTDAPAAKRTWQKPAALGAGGLGLVAVGVGTVFGLRAMAKHDEHLEHCQGNICDQAGLDAVDAGKSAGTISTIAFGVGAVAIAGAAVLWLTAPKAAPQPPPTGAQGLRVGLGGLGFGGAW